MASPRLIFVCWEWPSRPGPYTSPYPNIFPKCHHQSHTASFSKTLSRYNAMETPAIECYQSLWSWMSNPSLRGHSYIGYFLIRYDGWSSRRLFTSCHCCVFCSNVQYCGYDRVSNTTSTFVIGIKVLRESRKRVLSGTRITNNYARIIIIELPFDDQMHAGGCGPIAQQIWRYFVASKTAHSGVGMI